MIWGIVLSVVSAVVLVFADLFKKRLGAHAPYETVIWTTVGCGAVIGFIASVLTGATISDPFQLLWLPLATALFIAGEITFIRSITVGELSEVAPLRAAGPIFSLIAAMALFSETPEPIALAGVALVVVGVWLLSPRARRASGPVFSPGMRFMILSQFLGVGMSLAIKAASEGVSPLLFFSLVMLGEWLYFSWILWRKGENPLALFRRSPAEASAMAMLWGVGIIGISIAPVYTLVAYAYAGSQVYLPVSLVVSYLFLGEREVLKRIGPAAIILGGVVFVILGA